ncbi:hypothetical protein BKE38_03040 [Pseudoroseomonas deserti]|uniref:Uncharacterized protein n=1 Tax=Teichococcus deserti TaxID=1817963 RepID=A0A1V2H7Y9_9PROT|nr:hypothetical protein [Pseudoroseomonas deserti]ONG58318.1 hypothetical protein BKE38_03040 [Pseudoroseomonas deserti]
MAPPSWRIAPRNGRRPGWARAGEAGLPALPPILRSRDAARLALAALPWKRWHRASRQVMLAVVLGMGGGWFVGRLAVFAIGV